MHAICMQVAVMPLFNRRSPCDWDDLPLYATWRALVGRAALSVDADPHESRAHD